MLSGCLTEARLSHDERAVVVLLHSRRASMRVRHDEEIGFGGYAFVKKAEILAEQLARIVSGRVDDDNTVVRGMLPDVLKRRDDIALPSIKGASDEFLEICGILVCHRGQI